MILALTPPARSVHAAGFGLVISELRIVNGEVLIKVILPSPPVASTLRGFELQIQCSLHPDCTRLPVGQESRRAISSAHPDFQIRVHGALDLQSILQNDYAFERYQPEKIKD